ncbi:MAG: SurA N-terminal domain-containing protein [Spirochaetes bacterium]|nr:SurA N-terminal domain-containing protein [Spirochaetota bacterium]
MKKFIFISIILIIFSTLSYSARLNVGKDKIAKVNNHVITLRELEKRYNEMSKMPSPDGKPFTKKGILQSMIDETLLREEIRKATYLVLNEEEYNNMLKQYKMLYSQQMLKQNSGFTFNEDEFKKYVEQEAKITYEKFEERIKEQVLVKQYIMKKAEKKLQAIRGKNYSSKADFPIYVPNAKGGVEKYSSIEDFYDRNITDFVVPKFIELKHIFVSLVGPDIKPLPDSEKKIKTKKINDAHKRLMKGESFNELCELYSEDPESRDQINPKTKKIDRGYLGLIYKSGEISAMAKKQFGEENFNYIFEMKKKNYSKILEGPFGYHIFYIVDKKSQYIMPLEEAKQQIVEMFKYLGSTKILEDELITTLKTLKDKASIVYYDNEYKD